MTDLKNIIEVSFLDDGVSVLYYKCDCVYCKTVFSFFISIFIFIFIFIFNGCESTVRRCCAKST